jgi:hypothetical protein
MSPDDDPNLLETKRAHLATLADKLRTTVEQLQKSGEHDADERRKHERRTAGSGPLVIEHERRAGKGRRHDDGRESQNP